MTRTDTEARVSDSPRHPVRMLQFGTGVFLLGFVDWIVERLNQTSDFDAGIVALKARPGGDASLEPLNRHEGRFHVWLRGFEDGALVDRLDTIDCLNGAINPFNDYTALGELAISEDLRWVVSNTTEAGITYRRDDTRGETAPGTFPAMLTALLYRRYCHFNGDPGRGLAILCCELIEDNGAALRAIVRRHAADWALPAEFMRWLDEANALCNTLVDRIVTGAPAGAPDDPALPEDALIIEAEAFHAWVIEAPEWVRSELPVAGSGLNIQFADDLQAYRERKVRILNGAHTACFAASLMLDVKTVYAATGNDLLERYLRQLVFDEICPTLGTEQEQVRDYAEAILQRFRNPHIEHRWQNIALNGIAKWRARLLPTLQDALTQRHELPPLLVFSLAALLAFYRGEYRGMPLPVSDSEEVIAAMGEIWRAAPDTATAVAQVLDHEVIWDGALPAVPGLSAAVAECIEHIDRAGLDQTLELLLQS